MKKLFAICFLISASAFAQVQLDYNSLDLAKGVSACSKEFAEASKVSGPNAGLIEGELTEGGNHEFDQTFVLKFGSSHPLTGTRLSKKLTISRQFKPANCPRRAMDCGGGTFETTCKVTNI